MLRGGGGLFYDRPTATTSMRRSRIRRRSRTSPCATRSCSRSAAGLSTVGAPALNVYQYDARLPSSFQWNGGVQMTLPWSSTMDVAYTGQHSWNTPQAVDINAVDFGAAFLPQNQDPTLPASATPGPSPVVDRSDARLPGLRRDQPADVDVLADVPLDPALVPAPLQQRRVVRLQRHASALYDKQNSDARLQHARMARTPIAPIRRRRTRCSRPIRCTRHERQLHLGPAGPQEQPLRARASRPRHQRLAAVGDLDGRDRRALPDRFSYQNGGGNVNLTGSPDYGARVRSSAIPGRAAAATSTASSTPPRSRARSSAASGSSPATTT